MVKNKLDKKLDINYNYKDALGFIFIYGIVIGLLIPIMYIIAPFWLFIIYITNIDQITLALSVSFPDYFKNVYDDEANFLIPDISFHLIKIISLIGIFLYGLQMKLVGRKDMEVLEGMIFITIITYTLPDFFLPHLTKALNNNAHTIKYSKIIISFFILASFIIFESIILKNYIHTTHIENKGLQLF